MLAFLLMASLIAPLDTAAVNAKLFRFGPDTLLVRAGDRGHLAERGPRAPHRDIDAQAAGNEPEAYRKLREAAQHMQMIGDPVAAAIARQFPEKFAMN